MVQKNIANDGDDKLKKVKSSSKKSVLQSGIPPWHTMVFVAAVGCIGLASLPSSEMLDDVATIDTLTRGIFPDLISIKTLAMIRLAIATIIWYTTFQLVFFSSGWLLRTIYRPGSKLNVCDIPMKGIRTLVPFTTWSWILLGLSFTFNGIITLLTYLDKQEDSEYGLHMIEPWMLRTALILWELSAPFAILVSSVVRYAIWPVVLATGRPHTLSNLRNRMMHNCNTIFAVTEMALLGGIPVSFYHIAITCVVGVIYILFTWTIAKFLRPEYGPQYLYWFMDTTVGTNTTIALAALWGVLMLSLGIFVVIQSTVIVVGGTLLVNTLCVVVVTSAVCRWS